MKKFPATIYVKLEDDGSGDKFLLADNVAENHVQTGDTVKVATYHLAVVRDLKGIVEEV